MSSPLPTLRDDEPLYYDKTNAIADICRTLHISRATLYRYIKAETAELT